jgi:glycosyltransferase involved in cell wall biosynthesis
MMDLEAKRTAILFWGTRGGPIRQVNSIMMTAKSNNLENYLHWVISENAQGLNDALVNSLPHLIKTEMPKFKIAILLNFFKKRIEIRKAMDYFQRNHIERVFFLLPHPWDIALSRKIKKHTSIEVWRGIHDLDKHPGDFWPTKRAISQALKFLDVAVSFSSHTTERLRALGQIVLETELYEPPRPKALEPRPGSILFVGRIRKYKGLKLLNAAWPLISHPQKSLTIAGKGRGISFYQSDRIKIHNKWLTDREIEDLIDAHAVVVLPYLEASQSGVIPIATSRGVPVVVTPVGGLPSQIHDGVSGIVSKGLTETDLAIAIDSALQKKWDIPRRNDEPLKIFLLKLIQRT